ncbi:S8 family peptidase [Halosolutus amylolyticus]|uniref:S8 family peptidase n=1 Tax=Halosolutus amylolyticus TaxID=2932267 RepID=A0ABD5PP54_9EURY|nr:S8 family peptidase [Halosolutus amylolyticus]
MVEENNVHVDRRSVLKAAGALGAFFGMGGVASATPGRTPGPKEDEILVGTADGVGIASAQATVERNVPDGAAVVHENDELGYMAVEMPDDRAGTMDSTIDRLERQPGIEYAERNATYYTQLEPNDPQFGQQYAPQQVRADDAWDTTLGSMDVTVAVVDQGVDYTHPDLADRFEGDEGYDFVDNDEDPAPVVNSENHGTHVAGCAAATTDNAEGTAGIANCRLISGRALGSDGGGSLSDIADAIQWAADQGADIINMSLGGGGANTTMRNAIDYAYENGSLPIAAAGNDGGAVSYPAAYENCMAVSAIDQNENLASFSNRGPEINVAAPGVDVLAPVPGGTYESLSGTSMACPVASGVAALGKGVNPDDSPADLWQRLENSAVDVGLSDDQQGAGRVDALNIVDGGDPDDPDDPDDPGDGECGDEVATDSVEGYLSGGYWGSSDAYTYTLDTANPCSATVTLDGPSSADFDLYLTLDGRTPSTWDYDASATSYDSQEEIQVDLSGDEELGILVDAYSGSGSYTVTIEELGK